MLFLFWGGVIFLFWLQGVAPGILVPPPEIEPMTPSIGSTVLTTGLPGKSLFPFFEKRKRRGPG